MPYALSACLTVSVYFNHAKTYNYLIYSIYNLHVKKWHIATGFQDQINSFSNFIGIRRALPVADWPHSLGCHKINQARLPVMPMWLFPRLYFDISQ